MTENKSYFLGNCWLKKKKLKTKKVINLIKSMEKSRIERFNKLPYTLHIYETLSATVSKKKCLVVPIHVKQI